MSIARDYGILPFGIEDANSVGKRHTRRFALRAPEAVRAPPCAMLRRPSMRAPQADTAIGKW